MNSKSVTYLSVVFGCFFVGQLFPFGSLIGAPLSFVALAYFGPMLGRRVVAEMFLILTLGNVILNLPSWLAFYASGLVYMQSMGLTGYGAYSGCFIFLASEFVLGRYLAYRAAGKIMERSKLWQRYPLT